MDLNGAQLGRYHIIGLIGQGGMGTVYRAWCTRLDREVALKVLSPMLERDESARRQLEREACLLARVRHPGVVRVLDFDRLCDTTFYVMEMVSDPTLASMCDWRGSLGGRLPLRYAGGMLCSLLEAVQAMHAAGIVHRDLKPANVFVSSRGQARICDFGLACEVTPNVNDTPEGLTSGTLAYMSPEQLVGDPVDARTDVYALGLILYRTLAGQLPFDMTVAGVSHAKLGREELNDIRELKVDVPDSLALVARTACARDPSKRYQSADEMLAALKLALKDAERVSIDRPRMKRPRRITQRIASSTIRVISPIGRAVARMAGAAAGFLLATLVMWCAGI